MNNNSKRLNIISYTMMAPWLIVFLVFTVIPILASFVLSFTYYNMLETPRFTGVANYLRLMLEDDVFLIALKNTLLLGIITGPLGYLLSFVIAWFISDMSKFTSSWLTFLFYSPSIAGNVYFIWMFIFSSDSVGLLNSQLLELGIIKEPIYWLTDPKINIYVCIIVVLWMSMGAGFLAFVAGFKSLNPELFEAGALDGVRNRWQEMWYITLPQMIPQLLIGAVLSVSGAFAVGYQCMSLTGFPSTDYSTHTMVLHIYDYGYVRIEMGYASAVAVVLFVFMFATWKLISKMLSKVGS
ncbi:MAG: sugar ABC transporter permease [Ruminococcaceae bacterium]|nr:sugar ABC transporter permease [Oscillospiraceae bacterium]